MRTLAVWRRNSFVKTSEPSKPENANFKIICSYGDWSGYMTFQEAATRMETMSRTIQRPDGFFELVED